MFCPPSKNTPINNEIACCNENIQSLRPRSTGSQPDQVIKEDWVYFWRKAGKGFKKSLKTGKAKKVLRKTGKNVCVGNRKMPFLSRGNPEKLENMAETGKYNLKFAETGKVLLEAAESRKSPKRQ